MSGVSAVSYWLGNYAWDLINAFVIVIIAFLLIAAFQTDGYQGQGLGAVFVLMVYIHCTCIRTRNINFTAPLYSMYMYILHSFLEVVISDSNLICTVLLSSALFCCLWPPTSSCYNACVHVVQHIRVHFTFCLYGHLQD